MTLAGITISVGILIDQAIVMGENATHHLTDHFGDERVTGDTREIVIRACRTVGRPIFFSVLIMLISFLPVFALTGREGKMFHPLAFTKSFALVGVALLSITLVPALIPTFIRGQLRSEEENWIVRSFIDIYKPMLTWALPRAQPRHVGVRRAADPGGRHVPLAGAARPGRVALRLGDLLLRRRWPW